MPKITLVGNNTQRIKAKPCCIETNELLPSIKQHQHLPAEVTGKYPEEMSRSDVLMRFIFALRGDRASLKK